MTSETVVAEILGIRAVAPPSHADMIARLQRGLPVGAVERVAKLVAPEDRGFPFRFVPRATLARRRSLPPARAKLSAEEGARVMRVARIWAFARDVWQSDAEARAFLRRPHPLLEGRPPLDVVMESEFGAPRVEAVLGRLRYGSAA